MASTFDIRQLAVDRQQPQGMPGRRRKVVSRYVLPLALVAGFAALLAWAARDSFLPARPVSVVPVIASRAEVQRTGAPLFRAAGWIEPRPSPVLVTALAEGVVDCLFVVEGELVEPGQELAGLNDADARIALGQAEAEADLQRAEVASAQATHRAAIARRDRPVHLQAAVAEIESKCARVNRELVNLPFAIRAAQARLELARQTLENRTRARDVVPGRLLQQATSELSEAEANAEELAAGREGLTRELAALNRQRQALSAQLELKTEEHRQVAEADAALSATKSRLKQAELAVDAARLRLQRMTIRSPIAGRVLALHSQPGKRLMGMDASSSQDSSTVLSLYLPEMLQVRADVRLEDVPQVHVGQQVRLETAAMPDEFAGEVIMTTSQADIQKNTLQVKIAIANPPPVLKPDMLVQATFLAAEQPRDKSDESGDPWRLLIPKQLVDDAGQGSQVWIADLVSGVARRRTVKLGPASSGELVEVTEGLSPTDKLIAGAREGLREGDRITIAGEDATWGSTARTVRREE